MDKPSFEYVNGKVSGVDGKVGTLSNLETTVKTDLVSAVNELFTSVSNGKTAIASAITDMGVTTASDAAFATMASNIRSISGGGGGDPTPTPTNYRVGKITLSSDVSSTAVKAAEIDADALSHKNDTTFLLFVFSRFGGDSTTRSVGAFVGNVLFGGTRYGLSIYQTSSTFPTSPIEAPANQASTGLGKAYVGADGIYLVSTSSYKWKAGDYSYLLVW